MAVYILYFNDAVVIGYSDSIIFWSALDLSLEVQCLCHARLVEVRQGGVRQVIRLPRNKSEQQISVTFTIPSLQSRSGL